MRGRDRTEQPGAECIPAVRAWRVASSQENCDKHTDGRGHTRPDRETGRRMARRWTDGQRDGRADGHDREDRRTPTMTRPDRIQTDDGTQADGPNPTPKIEGMWVQYMDGCTHPSSKGTSDTWSVLIWKSCITSCQIKDRRLSVSDITSAGQRSSP